MLNMTSKSTNLPSRHKLYHGSSQWRLARRGVLFVKEQITNSREVIEVIQKRIFLKGMRFATPAPPTKEGHLTLHLNNCLDLTLDTNTSAMYTHTQKRMISETGEATVILACQLYTEEDMF